MLRDILVRFYQLSCLELQGQFKDFAKWGWGWGGGGGGGSRGVAVSRGGGGAAVEVLRKEAMQGVACIIKYLHDHSHSLVITFF